MTRSGSKKLYMAVIMLLLATAYYVHGRNKERQMEIDGYTRQYERLGLELKSGNKLSSALADLDSFTINEYKVTHLDILRYLSLEESNMEFNVKGKESRKVAGAEVFVRRFTLYGVMPYSEALDQVDWLYNTKKVVINHVKLAQMAEGYGDLVKMTIEGTLYGLDKGAKG